MSAHAVRVRGLTVRRGGQPVVKNLDLTVDRGEVTGLLGPSGSGKTTLLRALVGVQVVESGVIEVLGQPAGTPELRHRVGYVTQAPSVYADLSIRDNVRYFAKVLGAPDSDVHRVLADVDLDDVAGQRVGQLSGGQRSRVSLAVALLGTPDMLVLDEPTVGLDPVLRRDLWHLFHRLADAGLAVLVSSHVMDEATRCDRLLLLRDGELLADGSMAELLSRTGASDMESAFLTLIEAGGS
jgi:ABC-2 type transport system ATP-binding protein